MRKILVSVTLAAGVLTGTLASTVPAAAEPVAPPSAAGSEITPMLWGFYKEFDDRQLAIDVGEYGIRVGWWRAYYIEWVSGDFPWKLYVDYI